MLRSARLRIVVLAVGALAVALLSTVVVTRYVLLDRLDDRVDRGLVTEVQELRALAESGLDPATGRPFTDVGVLLRLSLERSVPERHETELALVDGLVTARSAQAPAARLDTDPDVVAALLAGADGRLHDVRSARGTVRFAAVPVTVTGAPGEGVFVAASFRDLEAQEVDDVVRVMLLVGLGALAGTALLVAVLAGRVLRPVRMLRRAAADIGESDLSGRIAVPPTGGDDVVETARAFNRMLDRLEEAFDGQRRFVDDAGHELRTPLTIVRGHLEQLPEDPERRVATTALVLDEVDRMSRLVDELLLLARADRPDFVRPGTVDVGQLLDEVEAKALGLADREWQREAHAEGTLPGDRQRLTQALLQLAANAVQHTRDGDDVWFGAARDGDRVRLWVRDAGPGFAPEDRERVFARFARGGDGGRGAGTAGLGLAIVRAIAQAHGGTARVVSGSTVELDLPGGQP